MKVLFFSIFILILPHIRTFGQTSSSCVPPAFLTTNYGDDAKNLAVTRMYAIQSADTSFINIPAIDKDSILNGMAAIFNLDTVLQADSVFKRYCIHTEIEKSLTLLVDISTTWGQRWKAGDSLTGYGALDSFMSLYGFTHGPLSNLYGLGYGLIATNRVINMHAFTDSLLLFTGIYDIKPNYLPGSPSTYISYSRDTFSKYSFSILWEDCPSGCMNAKTWNYKVDDLCNVTLLSVDIDIRAPVAEPTPPNCFYPVKASEINNSFSIDAYPNPANNVLYISVKGNEDICQYTLTNLFGQVVNKGIVLHNAVANISNIPVGVYVLKVMDNTGKLYYQKIIKE